MRVLSNSEVNSIGFTAEATNELIAGLRNGEIAARGLVGPLRAAKAARKSKAVKARIDMAIEVAKELQAAGRQVRVVEVQAKAPKVIAVATPPVAVRSARGLCRNQDERDIAYYLHILAVGDGTMVYATGRYHASMKKAGLPTTRNNVEVGHVKTPAEQATFDRYLASARAYIAI
jgi:hypothetical protein